MRNFMFVAALAAIAATAACTASKPVLTIGGKSTTEQNVLVEIIAQHLNARTQNDVRVNSGLGLTAILHQALLMNEIDLYVESSGAVVANILKETPDKNPDVVFERMKGELDRLAKVQVLGKVGVADPFVIAIRTVDATAKHLTTITEAANTPPGWDFASSSDFMARTDGNTAFQSTYNVRLKSVPRPLPVDEMYRLLKEGHITMVAGSATDGYLVQPELTVLQDDKNGFPSGDICVMTRAEVLAKHPELTGAIKELAGKLTVEISRKLNAEVDLKHRSPKDVAADFLSGRIK